MFKTNDRFNFDQFEDGDVVVYDREQELTHILNSSSAQIIAIIDAEEIHDIEYLYEKYCAALKIATDSKKYRKDFDDVIAIMLDQKILVTV